MVVDHSPYIYFNTTIWYPGLGGSVRFTNFTQSATYPYPLTSVTLAVVTPWNTNHSPVLVGINSSVTYTNGTDSYTVKWTEEIANPEVRTITCSVERTVPDPGWPGALGREIPNQCRTLQDNIFTSQWHVGFGFVQFVSWNRTTSPLRGNMIVRRPWETSGGVSVVMEDQVEYSWFNPADTAEIYKVKVDFTYFTGQPSLQYVDWVYECWWKGGEAPELTVAYVSTVGSDANAGTGWGASNSFRSISKAHSRIVPLGTIYIQDGWYDNETGMDPLRPCQWDIRTYAKADAASRIMVSPLQSVFSTVGQTGGNPKYGFNVNNSVCINHLNTVGAAGTLTHFGVGSGLTFSGTRTVKLKVFRINGANFDFVGESQPVVIGAYDQKISSIFHWRWLPVGGDGINVKAGDLLAIYATSSFDGTSGITSTESNKCYIKSGDIVTSTAINTWTRNSAYQPCIYAMRLAPVSADYGNTDGSAGIGASGQTSYAFSISKAVPMQGTITQIQAKLTLYDGTANAIVLRPVSGSTYTVIYNSPFQTQVAGSSSSQICSSTVSIDVLPGDVVGAAIYNGAIHWRNQAIPGSYTHIYANFNKAVGETILLGTPVTLGELSIKYSLATYY